MVRTSFGRFGLVLATLLGTTGCRALLDGDDLDLHGGQGGGGAGPSTGTDGPATSGGGGGDGPTTATSTGPGGGATSSTSTSTSSTSSTTTSSTTTSTGTGGGTCGDGILDDGEECDDEGPDCGEGCTFVGGFSCADPIDVDVKHDETIVVATTTTGGASDPQSCQFFTGPSRFVRVTPATDGWLTAWLSGEGTSFLSAMSVRTACSATLICVDSSEPAGGEVASVQVEQGVPVWFQVTSPGEGPGGDFTMELTLDRGTCVDPVEIRLDPGSGGAAYGNLVGEGQDAQSGCGGTAEDVVFRITGVGAVGGNAIALPQDDFDAVLYARPTCGTAQGEACVDAGGVGASENLPFTLEDPVHVVVDSDTPGAGEFSLSFLSYD